MRDRFGEYVIAASLALFSGSMILIAPLGSTQMYWIVAYLFATPVLGGLLYIWTRDSW